MLRHWPAEAVANFALEDDDGYNDRAYNLHDPARVYKALSSRQVSMARMKQGVFDDRPASAYVRSGRTPLRE